MDAHLRNSNGRITISGEVDLAVIAPLEQMVNRMCLDPLADGQLDLDLSDVTFIDSGGLTALLTARTIAHHAGVGLSLSNPAPCVSRLIAVTGLDRLLEIPALPARQDRGGKRCEQAQNA